MYLIDITAPPIFNILKTLPRPELNKRFTQNNHQLCTFVQPPNLWQLDRGLIQLPQAMLPPTPKEVNNFMQPITKFSNAIIYEIAFQTANSVTRWQQLTSHPTTNARAFARFIASGLFAQLCLAAGEQTIIDFFKAKYPRRNDLRVSAFDEQFKTLKISQAALLAERSEPAIRIFLATTLGFSAPRRDGFAIVLRGQLEVELLFHCLEDLVKPAQQNLLNTIDNCATILTAQILIERAQFICDDPASYHFLQRHGMVPSRPFYRRLNAFSCCR